MRIPRSCGIDSPIVRSMSHNRGYVRGGFLDRVSVVGGGGGVAIVVAGVVGGGAGVRHRPRRFPPAEIEAAGIPPTPSSETSTSPPMSSIPMRMHHRHPPRTPCRTPYRTPYHPRRRKKKEERATPPSESR